MRSRCSARSTKRTETGSRSFSVRTESGVSLGNGGHAKPASFTIEGDAGAIFDITLPGNEEVVLQKSGDATKTMTVTDFTSSLGTSDVVLTAGSVNLKVGATLNVGANQEVGAYSATFNVSVAYN